MEQKDSFQICISNRAIVLIGLILIGVAMYKAAKK